MDEILTIGTPYLLFIQRNPIIPTLRHPVYSIGLRETGDSQTWDTMIQHYEAATSSQEKHYILFALAQAKDIWLIQR